MLRLGALQLTSLDRVPAHAAVDTSVALAKTTAGARAGGFVNAVLRRLGTRARHRRQRRDGRRTGATGRRPPRIRRGWSSAGSSVSVPRKPPSCSAGTTRGRGWSSSRRGRRRRRWSAAGGRRVSRSRRPRSGRDSRPAGTRPRELPGFEEGAFIVQDPAQALLARFARPAARRDACTTPARRPAGRPSRSAAPRGRVIAADVARARVAPPGRESRARGQRPRAPGRRRRAAAAGPAGGRRAGGRALPRDWHVRPPPRREVASYPGRARRPRTPTGTAARRGRDGGWRPAACCSTAPARSSPRRTSSRSRRSWCVTPTSGGRRTRRFPRRSPQRTET